jgi:hypothetical protein
MITKEMNIQEDLLPSGIKESSISIVGNMATAKLTQMIKIVIDGNRLFMENRRNIDAETQMLQHKCETQTQTLKHSAETELEHRS